MSPVQFAINEEPSLARERWLKQMSEITQRDKARGQGGTERSEAAPSDTALAVGAAKRSRRAESFFESERVSGERERARARFELQLARVLLERRSQGH